jgi:hypothetical protein
MSTVRAWVGQAWNRARYTAAAIVKVLVDSVRHELRSPLYGWGLNSHTSARDRRKQRS